MKARRRKENIMKKIMNLLGLLFSIQFFADAGTNVNATENMTNAYTGVETPQNHHQRDGRRAQGVL